MNWCILCVNFHISLTCCFPLTDYLISILVFEYDGSHPLIDIVLYLYLDFAAAYLLTNVALFELVS